MDFDSDIEKLITEPALKLWQEICNEYDIEVEIVAKGDKQIAQPVDPETAKLRNLGSGNQGIPAEFWFQKAKNEFYRRLNEIV